jgi:acyl-CoA synthetase (AMP-forming)/AMP-acid ligase II
VAKDRTLTEAAVLAHCRTLLPAAKTPKQVVFVAELPKSERGKVLRDKLREDFLARSQVSV